MAIPRRVYTQSHMDYVVDVLEKIATRSSKLKGYKIVNLKVDTSGNSMPIPVERLAMTRVESAAPVASEAGTSRRIVSIHAVIQLRF